MKFFSNDAKETTEDQAHDDRDVPALGSAEADPAAVPQQRAGSPWNDAPGTDTERDDFSRDEPRQDDLRQDDLRQDDTDVRTDRDVRTDGDKAVHTDAVDLPLDDEHDDTRDRTGFGSDSASDLGTVENSADVDERDAVDGREATDAHTYGPDGTVTPTTVDENDAVQDEGDFDSPQAVEPVTGEPLHADDATGPVTTDVDEDVTDTSADFEPAAVAAVPVGSTASSSSPSLASSSSSSDDDSAATADADVVPAAAGTVDKTPGSVEEPRIDRLFADGDSFAERFRDIQLRFVDSPKDATAEAAALVGEAVDRLTSTLKSQQESLASKSDDTERLRVELRGYRDMLNRLTAL